MKYYIGLVRGTGKVRCWSNNHRQSTVKVVVRREKDNLPTDLWQYLGPRELTKVYLRSIKVKLLKAINTQFNTTFTTIIID